MTSISRWGRSGTLYRKLEILLQAYDHALISVNCLATWLKTLAILLFLSLLIAVDIVSASQGRELLQWSEPIPLAEDTAREALPRVVVDRQGRIHFFWITSYPTRGELSTNITTTIVYRSLENDRWGSPVEILITPEMGELVLGSVGIDDRDILNVLWFDQGQNRNLYLSQAHTSMAENSHNWSTTTIVRPQSAMNGPDLVIENGGALHVVYARDNSVIEYLYSPNYGVEWSLPVVIYEVGNAALEAATNPRIALDDQGYIHVSWTIASEARDWSGEAVYYSRSRDGGNTWESREVYRSLPSEPTSGWINVAVRTEAEVILVWNRGVGAEQGRFYSWSSDSGDSWSAPAALSHSYVSGQTQWPLMVVDSANILHLLTVADFTDGVTAPRYLNWDGGNWSSMYSFPYSTNDLSAGMAIGLGNRLHVVHGSGRGQVGLLYSTVTTGAPQAPEQEINTAPLPTPTVEHLTYPVQVEEPAVLTSSTTKGFPTSTPENPPPTTPLIASIAVSFVIVLLTIVFYRRN